MDANNNYDEAARMFSTMGAVGVIIGIGQLLASRETLTWRIVIGRAFSSAGLGASSAAILAFMPGLPVTAQLGCAALIASLGTSAIERLFQKFLGR